MLEHKVSFLQPTRPGRLLVKVTRLQEGSVTMLESKLSVPGSYDSGVADVTCATMTSLHAIDRNMSLPCSDTVFSAPRETTLAEEQLGGEANKRLLPFHHDLGLTYKAVSMPKNVGRPSSEDFALVDCEVLPRTCSYDSDSNLALQEGFASAMIDAALGIGIRMWLNLNNDKALSTTVEFKTMFHGRAFEGDQLICLARPVKFGRQLVFMEAKLYTASAGRLVASSTSTWMRLLGDSKETNRSSL